jgi:hypothetical protein
MLLEPEFSSVSHKLKKDASRGDYLCPSICLSVYDLVSMPEPLDGFLKIPCDRHSLKVIGKILYTATVLHNKVHLRF